MTPTGGTRRERAEVTRSRLFDAAIEAFARNGFHATTTRDIAAAAGISPGALYVHHRSKEDLLFAIALAGHAQTLEIVRGGRAGSSDPVAQLVAVVREFAAHHARGHVQARVVNYELQGLEAEHQAQIRTLRRSIEAELSDIVAEGVSQGRFEVSNARMATVALLSLGVDVARWFRDDGAWTPEEVGDYYAEIALRIVGASGAGGGR